MTIDLGKLPPPIHYDRFLPPAHAKAAEQKANDELRKREQPRYTEETCPGHVASKSNPKICDRFGVHIDSLRPD